MCGSSSRAAAARPDVGRPRPARARPRRAQRRRRPDGRAERPVPADRPDRPRPDAGRSRRGRCGRPLRGHPCAGPATGGRDLPHQRVSTYNVFQAAVDPSHEARRLGLERDGPRAAVRHRRRLRADRRTIEPRPESSYALSKLVGETMAAQFARRTGIGFVGLRISNIMEPADYAAFPSFWDDPRIRKWNLWGYVDARDVAAAADCARGSTTAPRSHRRRGRTVMTRPAPT